MFKNRSGRARSNYNPTTHRLREIERIISHRYRGCLPIAAEADVFLLTAAKLLRRNLNDRSGPPHRDDVLDRLGVWAERWAHFTPKAHFRKFVALAMKKPALEKADALAELLKLTYVERQYLKITTIGACDVSKAQRKHLSLIRKRERDRRLSSEKRRAAGVPTRAQYLAASLTATRPWEKNDIS